jgi:aryl-phospho-beta-D-glucosidase BglC (GH1 family)
LNWFGFETSSYAPHGLWARSWEEILDQIQVLGYNVIRLPFSNAMLSPGATATGIDYVKNPDLVNLTPRQVMDRIIAGAKARGIRIILNNHRSTAGGGPESNGLWYTESFPESRWIEDWMMLANRYEGNGAVIGMDLRNEPFNACWGCADLSKDWRLAAERAGNAILSVNSDLLIIVEGVAIHNDQSIWWGGNLMGAKDFPVRLQAPNRLVYSPHEYPASVYPQSCFNDPIEILDNRAAGTGRDTSERFEYKFIDNFVGWKTFDLAWYDFVRRSDWQPQGAPNDGFNRTRVWGFNLSPVSRQGSFQVDNIRWKVFLRKWPGGLDVHVQRGRLPVDKAIIACGSDHGSIIGTQVQRRDMHGELGLVQESLS